MVSERRVVRGRLARPLNVPVAVVSRRAYEQAGAHAGGPAAGPSGGGTGQRYTGGRAGGKGRPVGTRRDTWKTLSTGVVRAMCAAVVHGGFDVFIRCLFPVSPTAEFKEKLSSDLQERAEEYYRGEVWPLRPAFGVLSRYINDTTDEGGTVLTPAVVTTWLGEGGIISCSCVGRSANVARLRACHRIQNPEAAVAPPGDKPCPGADGGAAVRVSAPAGDVWTSEADCGGEDGVAAEGAATHRAAGDAALGDTRGSPTGVTIADAVCPHARTLALTMKRLCRRLGVPLGRFRAEVPGVFDNGDMIVGDASAGKGAGAGMGAEEWDAEGPLEIFHTGQRALASVLSGLGRYKVVAPVRYTRHVTSCSFCDNAAGFSCVHAVRSRGVRRGGGPHARSANAVSLEYDCVDGAKSVLPLPMFNCKMAVCVNLEVCELMRAGKPLIVEAPAVCGKCNTPKGYDVHVDVDERVIKCSGGYCVMHLQSFVCAKNKCNARVFPDGREAAVVLLSSSTAAMVNIMRDMAHAMKTGGSTLGTCYKQWHANYTSTTDSGRYLLIATVPTRSRQTMTTLFWWTMYLMNKSPPLWAF